MLVTAMDGSTGEVHVAHASSSGTVVVDSVGIPISSTMSLKSPINCAKFFSSSPEPSSIPTFNDEDDVKSVEEDVSWSSDEGERSPPKSES